MFNKLVSFFLSLSLLLESLPASAITQLHSPQDRAKAESDRLFHGRRSSRSSSSGSPLKIADVFGQYGEGDPRNIPSPSGTPAPEAPRNEQCADSRGCDKPDKSKQSSSSTNSGSSCSICDEHTSCYDPDACRDYWAQEKSKEAEENKRYAEYRQGVSQVWDAATTWPSSELDALGLFGGSLIVFVLGAVGSVVLLGLPVLLAGAVGLTMGSLYLALSPVSGALVSVLETLSLGKFKAKHRNWKDNPLFLTAYWATKITMLLGSVAFVPLALAGMLPVSLPILIVGAGLSAFTLFSNALGLKNKFSGSVSNSSSKPSPLGRPFAELAAPGAPEALLRGQGEGGAQAKAKPIASQSKPNPSPAPLDARPTPVILQSLEVLITQKRNLSQRQQDLEGELQALIKATHKPSSASTPESTIAGIPVPPRERRRVPDFSEVPASELRDTVLQEEQRFSQGVQDLETNIARLEKRVEGRKAMRDKAPVPIIYDTSQLTPREIAKSFPNDEEIITGIEANPDSKADPLFEIWVNPDTKDPQTSRSFKAKEDTGWHKGMDIEAPQGAVVTTERAGTVLYARYHRSPSNSSVGNCVAIETSPTTLVLYHHFGTKDSQDKDIPNSGILVVEGDQIEPNTPIGQVGNTGRVYSTIGGDGTHLHVGVIEVDPEKNPAMKKLQEEAIYDAKAARVLSDITKTMENAARETNAGARAAMIQNLMFSPDFRERIYVNPIQAIWNSQKP